MRDNKGSFSFAFDSVHVKYIHILLSINQDNLVLSTGLIMWVGHRKEIRKLTFRALALRRSESLRRRANARRSFDHSFFRNLPLYSFVYKSICSETKAKQFPTKQYPHVSGYFWIRNFFFPDSKISPSTRSVFKSNSPVHTHPGDGIRIHSSTQGSSALKCLKSRRRSAR